MIVQAMKFLVNKQNQIVIVDKNKEIILLQMQSKNIISNQLNN